MPKKLTHNEYLDRLKEKNIINIFPLEKYVTAHTKILHKCNICGYEWYTKPNNVLSGYGCPCCANNCIIVGKNDLFTTHPQISNMLLNQADGYKYGIGSVVRLDFICPECNGIVRNKIPSNVEKFGLSCSNCSDGLSIPNKFVSNVLSELNIDFECEKTFEWSDNKRYDFYFIHNKTSCILEVNGSQHYKSQGFFNCSGRDLNTEIENDKNKQMMAKQNNINNYIVLDCRKSELIYMQNSILDSELANIFDLSCIDFKNCYEKSLKSMMIKCIDLWNKNIKISDICDMTKLSNKTICTYLHRGNDIGLCEYLGFEERFKPVLCTTTGKSFNSLKEASIYYGIKSIGHICQCCRGQRHSCGKDKYGIKLQWEYVNKDEILNIAS